MFLPVFVSSYISNKIIYAYIWMIQSTYKTTFPVWTEKNLQVMRGVEIATDIPLLVYRFTHNRSQKQ